MSHGRLGVRVRRGGAGVNVAANGLPSPRSNPTRLTGRSERFLAGDYAVDERMVLEVTVARGVRADGRWWALNEGCSIPVGRSESRLESAVGGGINGTFFTGCNARRMGDRGDADWFDRRNRPRARGWSIVSPRPSPVRVLTPVSPHMPFGSAIGPRCRRGNCVHGGCAARGVLLTGRRSRAGVVDLGATVTRTEGRNRRGSDVRDRGLASAVEGEVRLG